MINHNQACFLYSLVLAVGCAGDILPGGSVPVNAAGAAQSGAENKDVNKGGESGSEGGAETGAATGGSRSGGVGGFTGGSLTGGRPAGGAVVGGTFTGGANTGGLLTGGVVAQTGGTVTGGVSTGGAGLGGGTAGVSPGGSLTYNGGAGDESQVGGFAGYVTGNGGEAGLAECSGTICPTDTGYVCVSLRSNNKHCGACGASCGTGTSCVGFECVCAVSDHSFCDGICVDLSFENDNCGLCGDVCDPNTVCSNGECVSSVSDKIEIRSYIEDASDLESATCPSISLRNISSEEISIGDLSMRYWYTKDGTTTDQIAEMLSSPVSATVSAVRLADSLDNSDFALAINIAENQMLSGNSSIEFQPCVHGTAQWITGYKLDNDWSYQAGDYEVNRHITVYQSGHLIWGDEPCPRCLINQACNNAVCQWNITDLPSNTHIYSYSWSEASSGCAEQGRRLCTILEIQAAYDAGFRRCQQGWTEDQAILTPDDGENCGGDGVSIVWAPTSQESNAHCCPNN